MHQTIRRADGGQPGFSRVPEFLKKQGLFVQPAESPEERVTEEFASLDQVLASLSRSRFRARFRLAEQDLAYVARKGLPCIEDHARRFVIERLAAFQPRNDGRQTPMRGYPVFVAQHATATCCRSCLEKWHGIPQARAMTDNEVSVAVALIMAWIKRGVRGHGIEGA